MPSIIRITPSNTHLSTHPKRRVGNEGRFLGMKGDACNHYTNDNKFIRSWFRGKVHMVATINVKFFCRHMLGSTDAKMNLWENLNRDISQILLRCQLRQQLSWRKLNCCRNITLAECSLYYTLFYFMDAHRKSWQLYSFILAAKPCL